MGGSGRPPSPPALATAPASPRRCSGSRDASGLRAPPKPPSARNRPGLAAAVLGIARRSGLRAPQPSARNRPGIAAAVLGIARRQRAPGAPKPQRSQPPRRRRGGARDRATPAGSGRPPSPPALATAPASPRRCSGSRDASGLRAPPKPPSARNRPGIAAAVLGIARRQRAPGGPHSHRGPAAPNRLSPTRQLSVSAVPRFSFARPWYGPSRRSRHTREEASCRSTSSSGIFLASGRSARPSCAASPRSRARCWRPGPRDHVDPELRHRGQGLLRVHRAERGDGARAREARGLPGQPHLPGDRRDGSATGGA